MRKIDSVLRTGALQSKYIYIFNSMLSFGMVVIFAQCLVYNCDLQVATFAKNSKQKNKEIVEEKQRNTNTFCMHKAWGEAVCRFCNYVSFGNSAKWLYLIIHLADGVLFCLTAKRFHMCECELKYYD